MLQPLRGHPQAVRIRKNQKYNRSISYGMPEVINRSSAMYTTQHGIQDKKIIRNASAEMAYTFGSVFRIVR